MRNQKMTAILYALAAALFYALSVPCSKLLLRQIAPTCMAGLLYLGAGLGVGIMYLFHWKKETKAERLGREDLLYTIGMVVLDTIAPILLMFGIRMGTSANASLLGNFEIAATTVITLLVFREKVSKWLWTAIGLITLSSILLSFEGSESLRFTPGSLFVLGAAICWGLENNCTKMISGKSTYQIVALKGLLSGSGSLITALLLHESVPEVRDALCALLLGFAAYGLSIFTYVRAQKTLGAAKTSAYYAVSPFIGVLLSFVLLHESPSADFGMALLVMSAGTAFVIYDTMVHSHTHRHTHILVHTHDGTTHTHVVAHEHAHRHCVSDDNHRHNHRASELEECLHSV